MGARRERWERGWGTRKKHFVQRLKYGARSFLSGFAGSLRNLLGSSVFVDLVVVLRKNHAKNHAFRQAEKGAVIIPLSGSVTMGLVSFTKVILPAFAASCVVSYAFWDLARNRKIFGGTVPPTIQDSEWEKETHKKLDAWPREAAGPVVMNPISRQNYHKT